jgi:hypothetical protein
VTIPQASRTLPRFCGKFDCVSAAGFLFLAQMNASLPEQFTNVTAVTRANVYFDGKVVSHTILFPDQSKKTLGLIYPGKFHFGTDLPERMEITAGECLVKIDGNNQVTTYSAGQYFDVPGKSGFDIEVKSGICQYICSFLKS